MITMNQVARRPSLPHAPLPNNKYNMYEVESYTDEELYDLLDLENNPSDKILEAKIIHMIHKYSSMQSPNGNLLARFFKDVYAHFFLLDTTSAFASPSPSASLSPSPSSFSSSSSPPSLQEGFNNQTEWMKALQDNADAAAAAAPKPSPPPAQTSSTNPKNSNISVSIPYTKDYINPLLKQTIKRIISVDSQFRGPSYPLSTDFTFNLSEPLKDVVELSLSSVQIPYTWYTVTNSYGANYFYLKGTTEGINYGNFDYKIEILPGNYSQSSLVNAINSSIGVLKQNHPEIYFGATQLSYNESTNFVTTTIEFVNIFNETHYYLDFGVNPLIYVNTDATTNDHNRKNNDHNIGGYFGYNYQTYTPNRIRSLRNLPPPTPTSPYIVDVSTGIFLNSVSGLSPPLITDGNYNNELNGQKYFVDSSNNSFHVILYQGPQTYSSATTSPLLDISMTLTNLTVGSSYTRADIIQEINTQIAASGYFSSESQMMRVYVNDPSMNGFKSSYFELVLQWDKTKIPNNTQNLKTVVIFPDETNSSHPTTTVWVRDTTNITRSSCFNFGQWQNELNDITGETPSLETNYVINSHPYMNFVCIEPGYTNAENTYQVVVPSSSSVGYSLVEYLAAINSGFDAVNAATVTYNPPAGILQNSYIENTDKVHIYIDLVKCFNNRFYNLNLQSGNDCFLSVDPIYANNSQSVITLLKPDLTTPIPLIDLSLVDLSENVVLNFLWNSTNSFKINQSHLLSIVPKPGFHNYMAPTWNVPANNNLRGTNQILITTISDFTRNIQDSLTQFQDYTNSFPLRNSTVTSQFYSYNVSTSVTTYSITINLVINKYLNQDNYQIQFVDPGAASFDKNTWYDPLQIGDFSYNLIDYDVPNRPYSLITGKKAVQTNILNLNADTTLKIVPYVDGVTSLTDANVIRLNVPKGSYTKEQLFAILNTQFSSNPVTNGSVIQSKTIDGVNYINIRLNINKVYTANDYSLVFYDLYSFVKCYVGVKSVRNVTWDSTLGWMLGYQAQTDYTLKDISGAFVKVLVGDTTVITQIYNQFYIKLDDYTQSHMNDGLVSLSNVDTTVALPSYAYLDNFQCDPVTGKKIFTGTMTADGANLLTQNQIYAIQEIMNTKQQQQSIQHKYMKSMFMQDIFGLIPIKTTGLPNGSNYVEFGGTLQNQQRTYFGPVNISRLTIQLLNDRGDVVDLNGANWSFSFICEQLYQQKSV